MNIRTHSHCFVIAALLLTLAACGGGGGGDDSAPVPPPPPPAGTLQFSAATYSVAEAAGTVAITITRTGGSSGAVSVILTSSDGSATSVDDYEALSVAVSFADGETAPKSTALTVVNDANDESDETIALALTAPTGNASLGAVVSATVTIVDDDVTIVIPPVDPPPVIPPNVNSDPVREWSFGGFPGDGAAEVSFGGGTQVGGQLDQLANFGLGLADFAVVTSTESIPADGTARGYIFGTPDGLTYGVYAESPFARLGGVDPIGSIARLQQTQSFIKLAADATLTFTPVRVLIGGFDFNLFAPSVGFVDTSVKGEVFLRVQAYGQNGSFFHVAGGALVRGSRDGWEHEVWNYRESRTPFWAETDFVFTTDVLNHPQFGNGTRGVLDFESARTFTVDLSSVAVGEEFSVQSETFASVDNRRGGGAVNDHQASGANAFLRDPLSMNGTTLAFTGLQPTDNPLFPPVELPVEPAPCVPGPGPDPLAGELQFSAANYSIGESAGAPPVRVIRTGGSKGAVTATFTTSDGTAVAGTDYTAVNTTVFFADGDAAPRSVTVPLFRNPVVAPDKTVNTTLSRPGGCAALGPQSTAVLTIRDDLVPPPPPAIFTIGGTASGLGGAQVGLVLQLPTNGESISVGDGRFTFTPLAASGDSYSVRIGTQPPNLTCTVINGTGTVTNASIVSVGVGCIATVANGLPAAAD
jgi:hypothetical protein